MQQNKKPFLSNRQIEILGFILIILSILFALSLGSYSERDELIMTHHTLIDNTMGFAGVLISSILIKWGVGYFAWGFIPIIFAWGVFTLFKIKKNILKRTTWFATGLIVLLSILFSTDALLNVTGIFPLFTGMIAYALSDWIGIVPTIIVLISAIFILISGYFRFSLTAPIESLKMGKRIKKEDKPEKIKPPKPIKVKKPKKEKKKKVKPEVAPDNILDAIRRSPEDTEKENIDKIEPIEKHVKASKKAPVEPKKTYNDLPYILPSPDLLNPPYTANAIDREELNQKAQLLTEKLPTFGVEGRVVRILPGPVITMYEIEPGEGMRVNKFVNLEHDIARVMAAKHVRIIAPIPGKTVVGIEIPNNNPEIISFRSIIESEKFKNSKSLLTIAVGKSADGHPFVFELDKLPHALIAGTTGSGKSVCINTIIMSILYRATPEEVKFILIDPKKIELSVYKALEPYHLITSEDIDEYVITNAHNAVFALRSAIIEMESRYDRLQEAKVRNIYEYNKKKKAENEPVMPLIVVVVDELADLMSNPKTRQDIELPIQRLAQMARAVGIHLVIATQRPSVNVITGLIRSNIPGRIAFNVATKIDSRTILDTGGAETLLGNGDMLYLPPGKPKPVRIHNAFVTLEEINKVLNHIKTQPKRDNDFILPTAIEPEPEEEFDETSTSSRGDANDELFYEAAKLVISHQQGSASLLQRRLKVGYARAGRLIDELEEAHIVGPPNGSKAREVLEGPEFLEHIKELEADGYYEDDE